MTDGGLTRLFEMKHDRWQKRLAHLEIILAREVPVIFETGFLTTKGILRMLVLSRNENETVYVGNDIVISVVKIDRNQVRLGITAPPGVPVHRSEVWEVTNKKPGCHENGDVPLDT